MKKPKYYDHFISHPNAFKGMDLYQLKKCAEYTKFINNKENGASKKATGE